MLQVLLFNKKIKKLMNGLKEKNSLMLNITHFKLEKKNMKMSMKQQNKKLHLKQNSKKIDNQIMNN